MILIIAEPSDTAALWLHARLAEQLGAGACLLTPSQLSYALSVMQHMGSADDDTVFRLATGQTIRMRDASAVINRVVAVPQAHIEHAPEGERRYASGELHAFMLGWLGALRCPVLNPPTPEGLAGPWHSDVAAVHFAVMSGFACDPVSLGVTDRPMSFSGLTSLVDTHFVLDGQTIGPLLGNSARDSMIQFARMWGARLVQIESYLRDGSRHFLSATSMAEYPRGGAVLVRAIVKAIHT